MSTMTIQSAMEYGTIYERESVQEQITKLRESRKARAIVLAAEFASRYPDLPADQRELLSLWALASETAAQLSQAEAALVDYEVGTAQRAAAARAKYGSDPKKSELARDAEQAVLRDRITGLQARHDRVAAAQHAGRRAVRLLQQIKAPLPDLRELANR